MGKPSSSCLKIIACGSDSAVEDDIEAAEAKGSGEKRGWSFRKRSARHRVLSNSITSESLTLGDKEIPQPTTTLSQTPADPAVPQKVMALEQPDVKLQPPASLELKPPKSIEPELSETLDAPKPPDEVSETLHAPKPLESVEPEVAESLDASESPDLIEPKTYEIVDASKSINLVDPKVSAAVDTSGREPTAPVESKIYEEVVTLESPASSEMKLSETVVGLQDNILEEPIIIVIQTGIRGFLAQRELVKLRSVVKLQATIRGHLVRRHAVDTLHCIQGIVKVQGLVRARHSKLLGHEVSEAKPIMAQSSTEKLRRNGFVRQLLESTPKSKSTVTTCDPLKPNSAWTWLERWMAVSSSGHADLEKPEIRTVDGQSQAEKVPPKTESENLSGAKSESVNREFAVNEASKSFINDKSSISYDPAKECQTFDLLSSKGKIEQPYDNSDYDNSDASLEGPLERAPLKKQSIESDSHSRKQSGSLPNNLGVKTEEPKLSMKRMASEQVHVESKKFAYGSRKVSNPAFVAAQSKFEELNGSLDSPRQDDSVGLNTASPSDEIVLKEKEPSSAVALIPAETRANVGGSECGTDLSVTSALDSPDRSEAGVAEVDRAVKCMEERASNPLCSESLEVNVNGHSSVYESNGVSMSAVAADSHEPEKPDAVASDEHNGEYVDLDMAADSPQVEQKPEESASGMQVKAGSLTEQPAYKLSPEASPNKSHITIEESQGTPSSQVSVKAKRSKVDKSSSNAKRSSLSSGKRTPAKPLHDSGARSSGEQLSKDQKSGKRRNSFGSAKSDNIDQEPRDSTSSAKALPSYMQATESARAKAHSPRSSPDVHDKDTFIIKKRHSLPGAGGRQGSPRLQQSTPQAPQLQPGKGNTNTPPQERKWLR